MLDLECYPCAPHIHRDTTTHEILHIFAIALQMGILQEAS